MTKKNIEISEYSFIYSFEAESLNDSKNTHFKT